MITESLAAFAKHFDVVLDQAARPGEGVPRRLAEAVRYSLLGPGKRVRPFLVVESCRVCGGREDQALPAAIAVECIHAFSLIHDDLPAMDDDDVRRGRPTCHRKYGEALAILAGDALEALAFETLARGAVDAATAAGWVGELASATGWAGMIGGQVRDLEGEGGSPQVDIVEAIHRQKTARLFQAACRMGAIAAGAGGEAYDRLGAYGLAVGLAYQIADDLLDETGSADEVGKAVAKDRRAGKLTYLRAAGLEGARRQLEARVAEALAALEGFGREADRLRALAEYVAVRRR